MKWKIRVGRSPKGGERRLNERSLPAEHGGGELKVDAGGGKMSGLVLRTER
jgi:hypothetical protein